MFKELKEYSIKYKDLKGASIVLNKSELANPITTKGGTKGGTMLGEFLNAVESVPDSKVGEIPEVASAFYENLSDKVFDDAPVNEDPVVKKTPAPSKAKAKAKAKAKDKAAKDKQAKKRSAKAKDKPAAKAKADPVSESDCPGFGTTFNADEENCQDCEKSFPDEYKNCSDLCAKVEKKKSTAKKRTSSKKTRYGHSLDTMTGVIDDLLWEGNTKEDISKAVAERFDRTPAKAGACLRGHLKRMLRLGVITLEERDDDVLKAENEYAEGFSEDNTEEA